MEKKRLALIHVKMSESVMDGVPVTIKSKSRELLDMYFSTLCEHSSLCLVQNVSGAIDLRYTFGDEALVCCNNFKNTNPPFLRNGRYNSEWIRGYAVSWIPALRLSAYPLLGVVHCVSAYPPNLGYSFEVAGYSAIKPKGN